MKTTQKKKAQRKQRTIITNAKLVREIEKRMAGNSWTKHKLGKETNAKKQTYKLKRKGDILEETSEYINLPEAFRCEEGQS
ncbi:hypothetical protein [Pectinatus cerevisiiphilus]|nr:hypothetical protein [Pectinatus cerevisiiphilus]